MASLRMGSLHHIKVTGSDIEGKDYYLKTLVMVREYIIKILYVTRFGKIRINAATNYFCFVLLTGYTGPEDLDFQV